MITNIDASLALSQDTITRNYQESQMTINLIFTTESITNRLIQCEINEEMKNFSDHLLIQTVINLRVCKESARRLCCNWKTMNEEKFINTLREQMSESLSNQKMKHQHINEYMKQLLNALRNHRDFHSLSEITWNDQSRVNEEIDNEIYLYEMLTTNLLQAMLVRRAEQSHQHRRSSNSALLMHSVYTQLKSETITTRLSTRWSLHIHRRTATSLHTCCKSYTTYTHILRRHDSAFAHIQTDVMQ